MGVAKYTMRGHDILKDGHTMFLADICADLKRKSFLEEQNCALRSTKPAPTESGSNPCKNCKHTGSVGMSFSNPCVSCSRVSADNFQAAHVDAVKYFA